jgi:hypothetical protein
MGVKKKKESAHMVRYWEDALAKQRQEQPLEGLIK